MDEGCVATCFGTAERHEHCEHDWQESVTGDFDSSNSIISECCNQELMALDDHSVSKNMKDAIRSSLKSKVDVSLGKRNHDIHHVALRDSLHFNTNISSESLVKSSNDVMTRDWKRHVVA